MQRFHRACNHLPGHCVAGPDGTRQGTRSVVVNNFTCRIESRSVNAVPDLVAVFEPDGTFVARDLIKLLAYSENFDVDFGSRTVKEFIWQGANMSIFLKWGNYAVAKLMEVLFNSTSLTDVGYTVRCINRKALDSMSPYFTVQGSFFGPEVMLLSFLQKNTVVQIPVNYTKRVGTSSVTGNPVKAIILGLQMIVLILRYRLLSWVTPKRFSY